MTGLPLRQIYFGTLGWFQQHLSRCLPLLLASIFATPIAQAVPSFSRQTGHACSICHVQAFGPNLTPYGRAFKLKGYPLEHENAEER